MAASLAKTEELVSGATCFVKEQATRGLQLPIALEQTPIHPPQVLHDRCVHGVMGWQPSNKTLELLWNKKKTWISKVLFSGGEEHEPLGNDKNVAKKCLFSLSEKSYKKKQV